MGSGKTVWAEPSLCYNQCTTSPPGEAAGAQRGLKAHRVLSRDRNVIKVTEKDVKRQGEAPHCLQREGSRRRGVGIAFPYACPALASPL